MNYSESSESREGGPFEVFQSVLMVVGALCGLVFGYREAGIHGAIIGFFFGGLAGVLGAHLFMVGLVIALFIGGLVALVWILGHFFR